MLMSRRIRVTVWVCVLALCASGAAVFFQKEIRITYHRNRMFAARENYILLCDLSLRTDQGPKLTRFTMLKFAVFDMSTHKEIEATYQHENALIELGYLEKREFTFTNEVFKGFGHSWPAFRRQVTNTFGDLHWWNVAILETNRLAITATLEDMHKWEKLISDFDR